MNSANDLQERIRRLERLLDNLAQSRTADAAGAEASLADPLSRLREMTAIVDARVTRADVDDGDRLAMRALLEEFRFILSGLRNDAGELTQGIDRMRTALDTVAQGLQAPGDVG